MPTVLLTGAAGFTGRYLRKALESRGHQVVPLGFEGPNPVDLTDQAATESAVRAVQPDLVVHLAAVSFVGHDNPEEFYRVNVFGTSIYCKPLAGSNVHHAGC